MTRTRKPASISFDAITMEGGLITGAMLASINARNAGEQKEEDYGVPKGLTLRDEIARYFRIGQALFRELTASPTPSPAATTKFVESFLRDVFGFVDVKRVGTRNINDRLYAVTLEALNGHAAFVVVPPTDDLDRASNSLPTDGRKRSASSALQDWLNANEETLWGLCCNGERIRLVRDNASFTRPAYIEANLRQIFENENFADFTTLWLLIHASRFGISGTPVSDCALERWREAGSKEGITARDRLRDGVEAALLALGNGFLVHPHNSMLRERLEKGELQLTDYFGQLLRLVYRLIFLLAAEDRNLLHAPSAPASARKLYADGYSLSCLRNLSIRRSAWDRHHDRWEGLLIVFSGLSEGESRLGLPALGGLFSTAVIADLEIAHLPNRALMEAIYKLAWLKEPSGIVPVNWRDMETEELGSVYESLLELTPRLTDQGRSLIFAEGGETKGNTRKTTGSYYTPDSLVQALLDSTLSPILDRIGSEAGNPADALLSVTVIDPACGSGHFLLAAARRIASCVARARAEGVASAEDYRHALRDVTRHCIYGVDRNPMAVELTKVALWIETVEPGKPLGFLDGNIRCGDALLGLFDLEVLRQGIPDAAYKVLAGDDKDTAKYFDRRNKAEKGGQGTLDLNGGKNSTLPPPPPIAGSTRIIRALPEDSIKDVAEKKRRFDTAQTDVDLQRWRMGADTYMAAFTVSKTGGAPTNQNTVTIPTTSHVWEAISGQNLYEPLVEEIEKSTTHAHIFHWPLEFPDIMTAGGFDIVIGNPPWERIKLQEQEFFASRDPEISNSPKAARARKIESLKNAEVGTREHTLFEEFENAKRTADASSVFARVEKRYGGRFPLTGCGDINTYALFSELFVSLTSKRGRTGIIVKTGIATDVTWSAFFSMLVNENRVVSLYDFENREKLFQAVDTREKFCLLTLGQDIPEASFAFFLTNPAQLNEPERCFTLAATDIARLNPNTKTSPVFRSRMDAELTKKIYERVPVFVNNSMHEANNSWNIKLSTMFHKTNGFADGILIQHSEMLDFDKSVEWLPVGEGDYGHQFDHRYGTFNGKQTREATQSEHMDHNFEPEFEIFARQEAFTKVLETWGVSKTRKSLLGFRRVASATNERTSIAAILPLMPLTYGWILTIDADSLSQSLLCANYNSLIFDYCLRNSLSQPSIPQGTFEQCPILPPSAYKNADKDFIVSRVLELTYTSYALTPFARDLGYEGSPFIWNEDRRALIRAELDAWYANAYGLTRDELRFILDPSEIKGLDYPSETFRVLREKEIKEFGVYRTRRLVLEAWDKMMAGTGQIAYADLSALSDGVWAQPSDSPAATLAQLAAIIKALPQPMPISQVRLAALYALEPQYLTSRLSGAERSTWLRLVGQAAQPHTGVTITPFAPRINAGWRDAVVQLRGMGAIIEDVSAQTWMKGASVNQFETETWPDGRASFVLKMLKTISTSEATAGLLAEDQAWIANAA